MMKFKFQAACKLKITSITNLTDLIISPGYIMSWVFFLFFPSYIVSFTKATFVFAFFCVLLVYVAHLRIDYKHDKG